MDDSKTGRAVWSRTARPHRVARDYAVVGGDHRDQLTVLGPAAAALFEEVATPRTVADLADWLDIGDTARLEAMLVELHRGGVLGPDERPTALGRPSSVRVDPGDDVRGVVLAHGLSTQSSVRVDDPVAALDLFDWAVRQRVVPLLAQATHEGRVTLPPSSREVLVERDHAIQRAAVVLETELLWVRELFDEAGLDFVLLKGLATGHLDHPSPAQRQTSDLDLLLSASDVPHAAAVLVAQGAEITGGAELNSIAKATTVRMPSGVEVDLHGRPVMLPYGMVELLPPVEFEVGGTSFRALDRPDRWAHAVAHYALSARSDRRASSLRDALATWPTPAEYPRWDDAIQRWRAATLLFVVEQGLSELGISITDPAWLSEHTRTRPNFYERELTKSRTPGPLLHWVAPLSVLSWRGRARHLQLMSKARWQRIHPG